MEICVHCSPSSEARLPYVCDSENELSFIEKSTKEKSIQAYSIHSIRSQAAVCEVLTIAHSFCGEFLSIVSGNEGASEKTSIMYTPFNPNEKLNECHHHGATGVKFYTPNELSRICRQNPEMNPAYKKIKHHRKHNHDGEEENDRREKREHRVEYLEDIPMYEQYYAMTQQHKDDKKEKKHKKHKVKEFSELNYQDLQYLMSDYNKELARVGCDHNQIKKNHRSRSIDQIPTKDVSSEHKHEKKIDRPKSAERSQDSQSNKRDHFPILPPENYYHMNEEGVYQFFTPKEEFYPKPHKKSKRKRKHIADYDAQDFISIDQINEQTMNIQDDKFEHHKHSKWSNEKEKRHQHQKEFNVDYLQQHVKDDKNKYRHSSPRHENIKTTQHHVPEEPIDKEKKRERRKEKSRDKQKSIEKDLKALKKYYKKLAKEQGKDENHSRTKGDVDVIQNEDKKNDKDKKQYGEILQQYFEISSKQEGELYNVERKKRIKLNRKEVSEDPDLIKYHHKKHEHKKHKTKKELVKKPSVGKLGYVNLTTVGISQDNADGNVAVFNAKSESTLDSNSKTNKDLVYLYQNNDTIEDSVKCDTIKLLENEKNKKIKTKEDNAITELGQPHQSSAKDPNKRMVDVLNMHKRAELFGKAMRKDFPTRPRPRLSRSRQKSSSLLGDVDEVKLNQMKNSENPIREVHCYDVGTSTLLDNNFGDVLGFLKGNPQIKPACTPKRRSVFHVKKKASREALIETGIRKAYDNTDNTLGIIVKGIEPPRKLEATKDKNKFRTPVEKPKSNNLECKFLSVVAIAPGKYDSNIEELEQSSIKTKSTPQIQLKDETPDTKNSHDKRLERLLKYYKVESQSKLAGQAIKDLNDNKTLKGDQQSFKDFITSKLTTYLKKLQEDNYEDILDVQTDNPHEPTIVKLVLPIDCTPFKPSDTSQDQSNEGLIAQVPKESFSDLHINYSDGNDLEEELPAQQENFNQNINFKAVFNEMNVENMSILNDFLSGRTIQSINNNQMNRIFLNSGSLLSTETEIGTNWQISSRITENSQPNGPPQETEQMIPQCSNIRPTRNFDNEASQHMKNLYRTNIFENPNAMKYTNIDNLVTTDSRPSQNNSNVSSEVFSRDLIQLDIPTNINQNNQDKAAPKHFAEVPVMNSISIFESQSGISSKMSTNYEQQLENKILSLQRQEDIRANVVKEIRKVVEETYLENIRDTSASMQSQDNLRASPLLERRQMHQGQPFLENNISPSFHRKQQENLMVRASQEKRIMQEKIHSEEELEASSFFQRQDDNMQEQNNLYGEIHMDKPRGKSPVFQYQDDESNYAPHLKISENIREKSPSSPHQEKMNRETLSGKSSSVHKQDINSIEKTGRTYQENVREFSPSSGNHQKIPHRRDESEFLQHIEETAAKQRPLSRDSMLNNRKDIPQRLKTPNTIKKSWSKQTSSTNQSTVSGYDYIEKSHAEKNTPSIKIAANRKHLQESSMDDLSLEENVTQQKEAAIKGRLSFTQNSQKQTIDFPALESKMVSKSSFIPRRIRTPRSERNDYSEGESRNKRMESSDQSESQPEDKPIKRYNNDPDHNEFDNSLQKCINWEVRNSATVVMSDFAESTLIRSSETDKSTEKDTVISPTIQKKSQIPIAKKEKVNPATQRSSSAGRDNNTSMFLTKTYKVAPGQSSYERRKLYDTKIRKNAKKRSLSANSGATKNVPLVYEVRYFNVLNQCVPALVPDQNLLNVVKSDQNFSDYSKSKASLSTAPSCFLKNELILKASKENEPPEPSARRTRQDEETRSSISSRSDRIQGLIKENLLYSKYPKCSREFKPKTHQSRRCRRRLEKDKKHTDSESIGFKVLKSNNTKQKSKITVKCSKKSSRDNEKKLKIIAKVGSKQETNDNKLLSKTSIKQTESQDRQKLTTLSIDKVNNRELCVFFENAKLSSEESDAENFEIKNFDTNCIFSGDQCSVENKISSRSTVVSRNKDSDESKETIKAFNQKEIIERNSGVDSGYLTKAGDVNYSETTSNGSAQKGDYYFNIFKDINTKFCNKRDNVSEYQEEESLSARWNQRDLIKLKNQLLFPNAYDDFELMEAAENTELIKYYVESGNDKLKKAIDSISQKEEMSSRSRSVISLPSVKMIPEENGSGELNGDSSEYSIKTEKGGFYNYQKFIAQNNKEYSSTILAEISKPRSCGDGIDLVQKSSSESTSLYAKSNISTKKSVIELFKLRPSSAKRTNSSLMSIQDEEKKEPTRTSISDEEFFKNFHRIMALECQKFAKKIKDQTKPVESAEEFQELPLDYILKSRSTNLPNSDDCLDSDFQLASEEVESNENPTPKDEVGENSSESFKSVLCLQENGDVIKRESSIKQLQKSIPTTNSFNLDFYSQEKLSMVEVVKNPDPTILPEESLNPSSSKNKSDIHSLGDLAKQTEKQFFDNLLAFYDREAEFMKKLMRDDEFFVALTEKIRDEDDAASIIYQKETTKKTAKEKKKGILSRLFKWKDKKSTEVLYECPSIGKSLEFAKSLSGRSFPIARDSCYSFYKDMEEFEKDIPEDISLQIPNPEHLQHLALKAKSHLEPMVKATMSNSHISDKIKLAGFLKLLELVAKGDFTLLNIGDSKTLEEKLREHVTQMFNKVYKIADREVVQRNTILDNEKIQLLKILVTRYHMGTDSHINILAIYIGRNLIRTVAELEDSILYLMGLEGQDVNLEQFEQNCGIHSEID